MTVSPNPLHLTKPQTYFPTSVSMLEGSFNIQGRIQWSFRWRPWLYECYLQRLSQLSRRQETGYRPTWRRMIKGSRRRQGCDWAGLIRGELISTIFWLIANNWKSKIDNLFIQPQILEIGWMDKREWLIMSEKILIFSSSSYFANIWEDIWFQHMTQNLISM